MCSIGEDDFGDEGGTHTMVAEPQIQPLNGVPANEICKGCNERNVAVKLNFKDAQCEPCFFQYVRHKFRAALGSTRIIERNARVLLLFDGSVDSFVLFDIVRDAVAQEQFKRLTIQPVAIYVDQTFMQDADSSARKERLNKVFASMKAFNFETYLTTIVGNEVTKIEDTALQLNAPAKDSEREFLERYATIDSRTAKEDFLRLKRMNVLRWAAEQINCKYIFVPVTSQHIATDLMIDVALGRGNSMANDISFCDSRCEAVKIVRPMRGITSLEVDTYVRLSKDIGEMASDASRYFDIDAPPMSSIQNLTKRFIRDLQENFASTVSTVYRTGDKITAATLTATPAHKAADPKDRCKFCYSELDFKDSTTLFATEYSRCVSACANQEQVNDIALMQHRAETLMLGGSIAECNRITALGPNEYGVNIDEHDGNENSEEIDASTDSLMKQLCHSCRNIFRGLEHSDDLIQWSIAFYFYCFVSNVNFV